jgi:hypothetical protein
MPILSDWEARPRSIRPNKSESRLTLIHAPSDFASFLRYPFVRFLRRGVWKRCDGFS